MTSSSSNGRDVGDSSTHRFHGPGTFDSDKEEWKLYQIRFQACLDVAKITADVDKKNLLIASLGSTTFQLLYTLVQPQNFSELTYQDLVTRLQDHFAPRKFKEFERARLFSARQEESENVKEFLARLRSIIATCEYETETNARNCSLLTAFIVGLHDSRIRARLVMEKDLTLDTALRLAESYLRAETESLQLNRPDQNALHVDKVKHPTSTPAKCFRCGNSNHVESTCRYRNESCNSCGKKGHIAKMCHSSDRNKQRGNRKRDVKTVTNVFATRDRDGEFVTCLVQGIPVDLQVDTGSKLTLLNIDTWEKLGCPPLKKSECNLCCFNNQAIPLKGQCVLNVTLGQQTSALEAVVTEKKHTDLLGRTWIDALKIDLNRLAAHGPYIATTQLLKACSDGIDNNHEVGYETALATANGLAESMGVDKVMKPAT
ncbi:uncharacterized protein LOC120838024 [Ixodes scapularis]|uniref:uncharacterized protein LOC120838024 n=1 Tax=Ixodes scapularis TaxID=6945 RepID=UPI001A9E1566|nr:uncharacterized protein LOC120838024 [Ixodes scapularis]